MPTAEGPGAERPGAEGGAQSASAWPRPAPLQPRARRALLGGVARCWCACPGPGGGVRGPRVRAAAEERGGAGARLSVTAGGGGGRRWWRRLGLLVFRHEAAAAGERAAGAAAAASVAQAGPLGRGRGVRTTGVLAGRRRGSQTLRQPAPRSAEGPAQCPELGSGRGCGAFGCGQQALLDRPLRRAALGLRKLASWGAGQGSRLVLSGAGTGRGRSRRSARAL